MPQITTFGNAAKIAQARELINRNQLGEAEGMLRGMLKSHGESAGALHLLATIAFRTGHGEEAVKLLVRAVAIDKNNADMWNDLAAVYSALGRLDEATDFCRRVVALAPQFADGYYNLGFSLFSGGMIEEALACYKKAVSLRPGFAEGHSIFLYSLPFHPIYTGDFILDMHQHWDLTEARALAAGVRPHGNDRTPDRRLRIGFVSPNLRNHPIGRFIEPLFLNHDAAQFDFFAYADVPQPDSLSERLRAKCQTWHMTRGHSDAQLADLIRKDQIDILVDLNMHMEGSRLLAFARKPAPVEATYLAYAGTTGLAAMDYRISDEILDPADRPTPYSEATVRLPRCYWCYQAPAEAASIIPVPRDHVTFGCLNNFAKISPQALNAWGQLMQRVPGSRLLMLAPAGQSRQRVSDALGRHGVTSDRLEFVGQMPPASYFSTYRRMDVALDPFPYGGGTTTCDALWMGVPVITLRDRRAVGRGSASILTTLNLPQWIAESTEQYVQIAADLANDRATRREMTLSLRGRMEKSPLMDAAGYARALEEAFRTMWRQWCAAPN